MHDPARCREVSEDMVRRAKATRDAGQRQLYWSLAEGWLALSLQKPGVEQRAGAPSAKEPDPEEARKVSKAP